MLNKIPNLRHLYAALEIADQGSISRAARAVHLSQSAVTQAVVRLEQTAGAALFERTVDGMRATAAGQLFVRRIRRAFGYLQRLDRQLGDTTPVTGPLFRTATATQLRALIAVVRFGGFSLAARELGVAQPSVHRAAKDLERLTGVSLFQRTATGTEATRLARNLARSASLGFAEIRHAFEEVAEVHGQVRGVITVGCLPLGRAGLLPDAATALMQRYPEAQLHIVEGPYHELLHGLQEGYVDLILGALREPATSRRIDQRPLFTDSLSLLVRADHPLLGAPVPTDGELLQLGWVLPRTGTPARTQFNDYFRERHLPLPTSVIECSSLVATRGLLLRSDRAAVLSTRQVALELETGMLATLAGPLPGTERQIGIATRTGWQATRLQAAFIEALESAVQSL
tara:strand:+ start:920 stop:2119 length:1200 start_codon:yes stop_codon:yes gene_type:complete